jgi:hypothetical protein
VIAAEDDGKRWKDEDELTEAVERRLVTMAQAQEFRAEG